MKFGLLTYVVTILMILSSCASKSIREAEKLPEVKPAEPSIVYVTDSAKIEELQTQIFLLQDALQFYRDSIPYDDYINARRIEKIKYYIRITENKPSNQKFFYGWIKRTMNEK